MSEVYDLTCYACLLLPESKLSQSNHAYHCFVPKLCHHRGKNTVPQRSTKKKAARSDINCQMTERAYFGGGEGLERLRRGENNLQDLDKFE